jgi:TonB family protein
VGARTAIVPGLISTLSLAAVWLNRGSGHPLLDQSALAAVRRWTFEPGRAAGQAVSSLVVARVRSSLLESP